MIKLERFAISRRPYAINPDSLRITSERGNCFSQVCVDAVWFRRRNGRTVAVFGVLRVLRDLRNGRMPCNAEEFLAAHTDGRYGGRAIARWDGSNFWAPRIPHDDAQKHQLFLAEMLDNYPAIPAGYTGWYVFEQAGR